MNMNKEQIIALKNKKQDEAVENLSEHNYSGIIHACVGFGKFFVAFKALKRMVEEKLLDESSTILFLAETNARKDDLIRENDLFDNLYAFNPMSYFKTFDFKCYQAIQQDYYDLIIADEIHDGATKMYYLGMYEKSKYLIGLTGTPAYDTVVEKTENGLPKLIKKQIYDELGLKEVFTYTLDKSVKDGLTNPFEVKIIHHNLSTDKFKYPVRAGSKKSGYFNNSEYKHYNWLREQASKKWRLVYIYKRKGDRNKAREFQKLAITASGKASNFLYNLKSKEEKVNKLIRKHTKEDDKIIVFGKRLDALDNISELKGKVCRADNTDELIKKFNNGELNRIASSVKLKQGITLNKVSICILHSYDRSAKDLIQKLGRILRYEENKLPVLYIICTKGSSEESILKKLKEDINFLN